MQTTVIQLSFPVSLFRPSQQRNKSISNFSKGHFNMAYELCVSFMYRKKNKISSNNFHILQETW